MTGTVLRRKAYQKLLEWKEGSKGRTAMLIDGSRRVGKTFLATRFASENYRSALILDFSVADGYVRELFTDGLMDLDVFFSKLMAYTRTRLYRRESVIVLDEVQSFPRAREALKRLVEDGRYDYIETGSLMSIKQNVRDIVIPSEEDVLRLNPLDFEEFLWALGDDVTMPYVRECFEAMRPLGAVHRSAMDSFRCYMLVGGMPQPVLAFLENRDLADAEASKRRLLRLFEQDVAKYAGTSAGKVRGIFRSIPSELSRKDKEFRVSSLSKSARAREYEDAFMWLEDGRVINQCFNATDPSVGLSMYADPARHKCYMADTGLLVTMSLADRDGFSSDEYRGILADDLGVNEGMFMENVVAQELHASGHELFYYARYSAESGRNEIEVDFLVNRGGRICPVEVKSSKRITHRSLDKFVERFGDRTGQPYVLCSRDLEMKDGVALIPVYMASLLRRETF